VIAKDFVIMTKIVNAECFVITTKIVIATKQLIH